jgi:Flp pilus assembly protein TadG
MKTQIDFDGITKSPARAVNRAASAPEAHAEARSPRRRALLGSGEQGQTVVEFALVMPALCCLMTAIFTFAIGFYNQLTLTSAVTAGAQYLQTIRLTTSNPCADTLTAIESAAPNFTGSKIGLTVSINGTAAPGGTSCAGSTSTLVAAQNDPVTVTATYPCLISIMSAGYGAHLVSSCQLTAKSTVYEY